MEEINLSGKRIPVIVGPTCSGKTFLGLLLADMIDCEIISADSRQVFKLLDIGTAKPEKWELKKVRHYFVDELNPDEIFNASMFSEKAESLIIKIFSEGKQPVVLGGSGLYIRALVDGISETAETDDDLRRNLLDIRSKFGNEYLLNELKKIDAESASRMLPQNWKRIIRAIEVMKLTGKPIWQHHQEQISKNNLNFRQYGIKWDREQLYKNIEERVDRMMEKGLISEIENILNFGFSEEINALNTVGYKEIIKYLKKECNIDIAIELIKRNSRRFAKRQMTWFNKDKRIEWTSVRNEADLKSMANKILADLNERKN